MVLSIDMDKKYQQTELERQLKEAKDEARIPSSGASDSSFLRTSTSIIRGSLYSNSLPWASILGESYSNLFRLMFHFHHCSTFTLDSACLKLLPTTSANKAAAYLHAQGRRPLCEICNARFALLVRLLRRKSTPSCYRPRRRQSQQCQCINGGIYIYIYIYNMI